MVSDVLSVFAFPSCSGTRCRITVRLWCPLCSRNGVEDFRSPHSSAQSSICLQWEYCPWNTDWRWPGKTRTPRWLPTTVCFLSGWWNTWSWHFHSKELYSAQIFKNSRVWQWHQLLLVWTLWYYDSASKRQWLNGKRKPIVTREPDFTLL